MTNLMPSSHSFITALIVLLSSNVALSNVIDETCRNYDVIKLNKVQHNYCKICLNAAPNNNTKKGDKFAELLLKCALVSAAEARDKAFVMSQHEAYAIGSDGAMPMLSCAHAFSSSRYTLQNAYKMWKMRNRSQAEEDAKRVAKTHFICPYIFNNASMKIPYAIIPFMEKLYTQSHAASVVLSFKV